MNIFNRIIMIILLLFIVVSSIVIVVNIYADLFEWSDIFTRILDFGTNTNIHLMALIFVAIIIIAIVLLIFEFYRRKLKTANVSAVSDGKAMISTRIASQQIQEDLADLLDIDNLRVQVIPRSSGAIVNIFARLYKGINVADKMQEVINKANKSARENLGVKIIKTNFTVTGFVARIGAGIDPDEKEGITAETEESLSDEASEDGTDQ